MTDKMETTAEERTRWARHDPDPDHGGWLGKLTRDLDRALARITELEATPGAEYIRGLLSRIAGLEAELGKAEERIVELEARLSRVVRVAEGGERKMSDSPLLRTADDILRPLVTAYHEARGEIDSLLAERDTYSRVIDTLSADNRRLAAERDKLDERVRQFEADLEISDLSIGEAYRSRSLPDFPKKKPVP